MRCKRDKVCVDIGLDKSKNTFIASLRAQQQITTTDKTCAIPQFRISCVEEALAHNTMAKKFCIRDFDRIQIRRGYGYAANGAQGTVALLRFIHSC